MNESLAPSSPISSDVIVSDSLIESYIACECTNDESAKVEKWIGLDIEKRIGLRSMRLHALDARNNAIPYTIHSQDIDAIMDEIRADRSSLPGNGEVLRRGLFGKLNYTGRAVAGIAATAVFAFSAYLLSPSTSPESFSSVTYTAKPGQTATVFLGDGSKVILNVGSALTIGSNFNTGDRSVDLVGEGLFDVQGNASSPFVVMAGARQVKVLGTSFVVSNYTSDSLVKVAVRSGRVSVDDVIVNGGRQVVAAYGADPVILQSDERIFGFESGLMTIIDAPLGEVIEKLNRWYNVEIVLSDPRLENLRIDGGFRMESPEYLAWILEQTLNVRVTQKGKSLIIKERVNLR